MDNPLVKIVVVLHSSKVGLFILVIFINLSTEINVLPLVLLMKLIFKLQVSRRVSDICYVRIISISDLY